MKFAGSLAALAVGFALVLPETAAAATAACTWRTSTLPMPAGASVFSIDGTDHSGGWAGSAFFTGDRTRVLAWKNGMVTDYGGVASTTAFLSVVDENRAGTIVLNTTDGRFGSIRLAYRIRGGVWERLAPLQGGTQTIVMAINDAGDAIGTDLVSRGGDVGTVVVRWPANQTTPVEVPGLPLGSTVFDIDQDGTLLVGLRDPQTQGRIPHVLRGGVLTAVPPTGRNQTVSVAAISNGWITGDVLPKGGRYTGVTWERDLTPHVLPDATTGMLINRDGLVVGENIHPDLSWGVWRNHTLEYGFGTFEEGVFPGAISDDGTFGGRLRGRPTVWRCG